jgi:hypothetical protein
MKARMAIHISPELEAKAREKAQAEGITLNTYLERLIEEDEDWAERSEEAVVETDLEFQELRDAVNEGLGQAERGDGRPAEQVFRELRTKHGISG